MRSENPLALCNTPHCGTKKVLELKPSQQFTLLEAATTLVWWRRRGRREARSTAEQPEVLPIFMKLPKLCLNSPMQIKAVIDFSWVGYLPPTDNLPVLTWTPAINLLGSKNKKQKYETPPIWGRKLPILSFTRLTYKIVFVHKSHSTLLSAVRQMPWAPCFGSWTWDFRCDLFNVM